MLKSTNEIKQELLTKTPNMTNLQLLFNVWSRECPEHKNKIREVYTLIKEKVSGPVAILEAERMEESFNSLFYKGISKND